MSVTAGAAPSQFGFAVRSDQVLKFVRLGGGAEPLEVVVASEPRARPEVAPIADWTLAGTQDRERATLYQVNGGFEFWATDAGGFRVEPDRGRIEIPAGDNEVVREQRLWGVPSMLCLLHRGDFPLHAAAVEVAGGAVVLAAPQRYGKTTLALAFHERGYRVLSEDVACCRLNPVPELLPGPAVLRIRPDVYEGRPPKGTHLVAARPDRIFLALDDDRKGSSAPVPIRAIVFLRESSGELKIERASLPVALADLWSLGFRVQTRDARALSLQQLSRLAGAIPVCNLYRPLRLSSLESTVELITKGLS